VYVECLSDIASNSIIEKIIVGGSFVSDEISWSVILPWTAEVRTLKLSFHERLGAVSHSEQ
jgi:hypothetical protein